MEIKTKRKQLKAYFSEYGTVEKVWIRSVPIVESNKPKKARVALKDVNIQFSESTFSQFSTIFKLEPNSNSFSSLKEPTTRSLTSYSKPRKELPRPSKPTTTNSEESTSESPQPTRKR